MDRRTFFKTAFFGAIAATTASPAAAAGIRREFQDFAEPINAANGILGPSLKGVVTNDERPERLNPLNPGWMEIEFGHWCWNMQAQYNCKWGLHLFNMVPAAEEIAKAIQHPAYDGWWLTLNEPDLENMPTETALKLIERQMRTVLAVDPSAKFCIGAGSQLHAPFTAEPWFPKVWKRFPADLKPAVQAFHTHYYPQVQFGPDSEEIFKPFGIQKYLKAWRKWMKRNSKDQPRQLWLTEIGLVWTDANRSDPRVSLYPLMVQKAVDGLAERWAWYSMSKPDGYVPLYNPYPDGMTTEGQVFAAINPGVYPV